jgi:hypothetical protein
LVLLNISIRVKVVLCIISLIISIDFLNLWVYKLLSLVKFLLYFIGRVFYA